MFYLNGDKEELSPETKLPFTLVVFPSSPSNHLWGTWGKQHDTELERAEREREY